jgi:hypothetical protein
LYLDADCFPVKDPTYLFDCPQYKDNGAVFLPDINRWRKSDFETHKKFFEVEYQENSFEFEAGMMLIDKDRCWTALNLCHYYNQHPYTYNIVFGDKDTFYMAWRRTNTPFHQVRVGTYISAGSIGGMLIQHDPYGYPLFRHLTGSKMTFHFVASTYIKYNIFPYRKLAETVIEAVRRHKPIPLQRKVPVTKDDIVVRLQSCEKYKDTRLKACLDTWAKDIPNLEVGIMDIQYSNSAESELGRWKDLIAKYPDKKWFINVDDDTYMWFDKIPTLLSEYDPDEAFYGGDVDQWRRVYNNICDWWVSGGVGLILSRKAIETMIKKYDKAYQTLIKPAVQDIFVAMYMQWCDIPPTNIKGFHHIITPETFKDANLASVHQVSPKMMYEIHNGRRDIYYSEGTTIQNEGMCFDISDTERELLKVNVREELPKLFESLGYKVGAEVGVWEGYFSEKILDGFSGKLYSIEPWTEDPNQAYYYMITTTQADFDKIYETCRNKLSRFGDRSVMIRKTSVEASKQFEDDSLDFVYIDGLHDYKHIKEDIEVWYPKVRNGGTLCGHDYSNVDQGCAGIKKAVDEFNKKVFITRDKQSTSWMLIKLIKKIN